MLDGIVTYKNVADFFQPASHGSHPVHDALEGFSINISSYATHLTHTQNDSGARGFLKDVEHRFTQTQALHKETFKPESIGRDTQPKDMAMYPGQLRPYGSQIKCTFGNLHRHHLFYRLTVSHAVHKAAQSTDPVGNMHEINVIPFFHQSFQPPVDVTYGWNGVDDLFILGNQVEMNRLGKYGVLGAERDNIFVHGVALL